MFHSLVSFRLSVQHILNHHSRPIQSIWISSLSIFVGARNGDETPPRRKTKPKQNRRRNILSSFPFHHRNRLLYTPPPFASNASRTWMLCWAMDGIACVCSLCACMVRCTLCIVYYIQSRVVCTSTSTTPFRFMVQFEYGEWWVSEWVNERVLSTEFRRGKVFFTQKNRWMERSTQLQSCESVCSNRLCTKQPQNENEAENKTEKRNQKFEKNLIKKKSTHTHSHSIRYFRQQQNEIFSVTHSPIPRDTNTHTNGNAINAINNNNK